MSLGSQHKQAPSMLERLTSQAQEEYPHEFAGAWYEADEIVMGFTDDAQSRVRAIQGRFAGPTPRLVPRQVMTSLRDLELARAALDTALIPALVDKNEQSHNSDLREHVSSWYVNVPANRLVITGRDLSEEVKQRVRALIPVEVSVDFADGIRSQPTACFREECIDEPFRGGLEIYSPGVSGCTVGFVAVKPGTGQGALTAGHCFQEQERVAHGPWWWGWAHEDSFTGVSKADAVFLAQDAAWPEPNEPWVYRFENDKEFPIEGVGNGGDLGQIVCFSGAASYTTNCGPIISINATINYDEYPSVTLVEQHIVETCNAYGDSGSPVHTRTGLAQGIVSGGYFTEEGVCIPQYGVIYSDINEVVNATSGDVLIDW